MESEKGREKPAKAKRYEKIQIKASDKCMTFTNTLIQLVLV